MTCSPSSTRPARRRLLACVPEGQAVVTTADAGDLPAGADVAAQVRIEDGKLLRDDLAVDAEPARRRRDPRPVARVAGPGHAGFGAPRARLLAAVFSRWEELVGPEIAHHAQPRSLRDGVLVRGGGPAGVGHPAALPGARAAGPVGAEVAAQEITEIQIRVARRRRLERGNRPGGAAGGTPAEPLARAWARQSHPPLVEWSHPSSGR